MSKVLAREIKDVQVRFVSLVPKGANGFKVSLKAEKPDQKVIKKSIRVLKVNEEKRTMSGVVYAPDLGDAHDEFMSADEIYKMMEDFMIYSQNHDIYHNQRKNRDISTIESYIAKENDPDGYPLGAWVLTVKIFAEEIWKKVKSGELQAFSFDGLARYGEKKEVETPWKNEKGQRIDAYTGEIIKASFSEDEVKRAWEIIIADMEARKPQDEGSQKQKNSILSHLKNLFKKNKSEDKDLDLKEFKEFKDEILSSVKDALGPIAEEIKALKSEVGKIKGDEEEGQTVEEPAGTLTEKSSNQELSQLKESISESIKSVLTPLQSEIETLKGTMDKIAKTKGVSNSLGGESQPQQQLRKDNKGRIIPSFKGIL